MMETNFTRFNSTVRLLIVILISSFSINNSTAQSCACKENIQVSLNENGSATITASMLLTDNSTCAGTQTVTVMLTPTGNPIAGSPNVDCSHIGKILYGKVSNGTNSCWSSLLVEDKIKPTITCPGNITLTCTEMSTFVPVTSDNCTVVLLDTISETVLVNNCNNGLANNILKRVTRTYQAIDPSGNVSLPCTIVFDVTRIPSLNDIIMPEPFLIVNDTELECDGPWAKLPNGNPSPVDIGLAQGTGVPMIGLLALYPDPNVYCNLAVTFTDTKLPKIGCVTKIMRAWQVIEWSCDNRVRPLHIQMIEIVDTEGPTISGLINVSASTSNHTCDANVTLPTPILADNCALVGTLTVDITIYLNSGPAPGFFIKHGSPKTATLPVGIHLAVYTAYDDCYNSTTASIVVEVEDRTPPVAICDEFATIGLTSDGAAWVPATVFDDGSYDECELGKVLVRRMDTDNCGTCATPSFPGFTFLGEYGSGLNKHYYYLSNHAATPKVAFKTAKAMGGYAASFETALERTSVRGLVKSVGNSIDYLIGFSDLNFDGIYLWESGSTANILPVNGITPSTQYVIVDADNIIPANDGLLQAVKFNTENRYVVEITDLCGWSDHAKFCCADIGTNQMVAFRAIDKAGNYNDCMVSAVIQDKIGPVITCPGDITVNCDFVYDPNNLRKDFGWATATDNCENPTITQDSLISINSCRIGSIRRTFTVTDLGGRTASCTQVITFQPSGLQVYQGPLPGQWPANVMVTGCGDPNAPSLLPSVLGYPILTDGVCSLVGSDYEDQTFLFNNPASPACFKILRYWTVIDWCQPLIGGGYRSWTHTQEIKVIDNTAPVFAPLAPSVSANTFDPDCADGTISLIASATDVCTQVLKWSYKIDLENDGTFDLNNSGNGNSINASGIYPVGLHKIVYTFEDKCGNVSTKEQLFSIVNKKAPNAYVKNGLSINLTATIDGDGFAEIWATDFDNGSSHPCGYQIYLSFTPVFIDALGNVVTTPNLVFDCGDIGEQDVTIYVAAVTPAGDIVESSVETFIDVQDNNDVCDGDGRRVEVKGTLITEANVEVENVNVGLIGSEQNVMTGSDGQFVFENMPEGGNYIVTPSKNDDHMNGVSTLDLVMIQRHVLNLDKLNSPFKLIAADINKDGKISAADLVELRKLVLGTTNSFVNNNSWRFVDRSYQFQDPLYAHGESFPEVYRIDLLNADMITDFIAIKVGDVNGNVKANNINYLLENRSTDRLVLTTDNVNFEAGQKIVVPVKTDHLADISGMQFTLKFNPDVLELQNLNSADLTVNDHNFGLAQLNNGVITFSWNESDNVRLSKGSSLFNITFITKKRGNIKQMLTLGSEVTKAEAYNVDAVMNIDWFVTERNDHAGFALYQNSPNPFKDNTLIGFELPIDLNATFTLYDVTGKIIRTSSLKGVKGYNSIEINKLEVNAGVMYYTLRAGEFTATKKMVVIE
ncbi:MAG: T9SS type A sorting domain-containing protein [Saprospiraceae bacterium]|nr:T9SS type A sorting domain-containing protein [Saprospiraceae bacterium]